jgi:two-component system, NtrC family, sensor kinase
VVADPRAVERFSLVRYFLAAGFVTAVAVAAAVSTFTAREVQQDLEEKSEDYAVLIARNLARNVHERFTRPTVARDGVVDLDRPEQLAALDAVVRSSTAELGVRKVYFFDLQGLITYSTTPEHRGFSVTDNPNYARAAAGQVSTLLVARGSPLDLGGQTGHAPLLETYVPIERLDDEGRPTGERVGVIEVYQDATELLEESRRASVRMAAIATAGIVALMLVLGLRIRTAQRTIQEKAHALVEVNDRLAALSADLERQVEDRTKRLVRAETLASVGTLAAGVAHEVNNPIASIASCAEGLLRRAADPALKDVPAFAEFPEYLEIIRDEAFRVKDVTRGLLDFSRAGADGEGAATDVDLGSLLQATTRLLAWRCAREEKRLELDLPPAPVVVRGDGAGLRQLLLNVTGNALDASSPGQVVRWTLRPASPGATLVCEDQGAGLSKEDLGRVLEPFFTRKPPGEGTGLGLSIAYGVARRHGGTLELTSDGPGRGARVTVHLVGVAGEETA